MKKISKQIIDCFRNGGKLLICGNGGSAAMSQEMAAELVCSFEIKDRLPLPALSLTTDTSILTAWSNDVDFSEVFSRQIQALGKPGDILLLFTTSRAEMPQRHSQNIWAAAASGKTIGLTWVAAPIKGKRTADIQEYQHKWMHQVCREVEWEMFKKSKNIYEKVDPHES